MTATKQLRTDIWERIGWIWTLVFYVSLAISLILALDAGLTPNEVRLAWILSIALSIWQVGGIFLVFRYPHYRQQPGRALIYVAGLLIIFFFLTQINGTFNFLLSGLYPHIFVALTIRYAIPAAILLNLIAFREQILDIGLANFWQTPAIWGFAVMSVLGLVLASWIYAIIHQSVQRRELIEELEAAQVQLAETQRREGMLAERQRLAQEIHDTLAQGFTSIVIHLEAAEEGLPAGNTTTHHHLNQARTIARHSLTSARRVVQDLRPELLEKDPLPTAISRTTQRWSQQSGIPATATTTGNVQNLHPEQEVTLLRATQEALANIQKHAQAQSANVTLSYMGDMVILDVQDDGVGFDPAGITPTSTHSYGLTAMRQRLHQIGGSLTIESQPHDGTTLVIEIPTTTH